MHKKLYDLLSLSELASVKDTEIRNVRVRDLTVEELTALRKHLADPSIYTNPAMSSLLILMNRSI